MRLHTRRTIWALGLLLGAGSLLGLGWGTQVGLFGSAAAARRAFANQVVTNLNDSGAGSLRQAIALVGGGETITFQAGLTGTITLTSGELSINKSLTIQGPGANLLTVSGTQASRVFNIAAGNFNVTLSALTIANGRVTGSSAQGGGILNNSTGTVSLNNCALLGNSSIGTAAVSATVSKGGGIYHADTGTLNLTNCTLSDNSASASGSPLNDSSGGGIYNASTGIVNLTNCTLSGNSALASGGGTPTSTGGGIHNQVGTIRLTNCTLSGNSASASGGGTATGRGGGIHNHFGTVNLTNSTLSGNSASASGAVNNSSIGGGIYSVGVVHVKNTIIAGNFAATSGPDVLGSLTSQGYNLIEITSGATITPVQTTDIFAMDPLLGPLQNNGGPTQTMRPATNSPAIDKGAAATDPATNTAITTDQRGFTRPVNNPSIAPATGGNNSDIGAVELFNDAASANTITLTTTNASDLINAIYQANEDPAPTTINLVCGTYTLVAPDNTFYGFTGLPVISSTITIEGNGAIIERSSANGTPSFRLLAISGGAELHPPAGNLTLKNVTLRNGLAQGGRGGDTDSDSAGGGGAGLGGAIYNQGMLTLTGSALLANTAQGGRGGNLSGEGSGEGAGGGGLGGNGGDSLISTSGGSGGGGFGGNGGIGASDGGEGGGDGGGGGGGTVTDGSPGSGNTGGAGGVENGGEGGSNGNGFPGGYGGGGGGGASGAGSGGNGGVGGGGGGGGAFDESATNDGGQGGFGGGGGGATFDGTGGFGGFGGGAGGGNGEGNSLGGFGGGNGGRDSEIGAGGGGGGAGMGGAIFNDGGTLVLRNDTISGNFAIGGAAGTGGDDPATAGQGLGGGVFARNGSVTINNVTFNNNTVTQGNGAAPPTAPVPAGGSLYLLGDGEPVYLDGQQEGVRSTTTTVTYSVTNTILANTPAGRSDAFVNAINDGTATAGTNNNNLVEVNGSTPGMDSNDLPGVTKITDPQLAALTTTNCAVSGCRTPVHTITNTSPAFNMAGGNAESVDQCGTTRPQNGAAEIGAYELVILPPTISKAFGAATIPLGGTTSLTFTIINPNSSVTLTGINFSDTLPTGLVVAPGIGGTCIGNGTVTAVSGTNSISYSGGVLTGGASCTIVVNVTGTTLGVKNNTSGNVGSNEAGPGNQATASITVITITSTPGVTIVDPFGCTGPGDVLTVTVVITNVASISQPVTFSSIPLPAGLVGLPGSGTSTVGAAPTVAANGASFGPVTLTAGQSATVTYQVQVADVSNGTTLCINTTSTFSGTPGPPVQACTTINCPAVGPGLPLGTGEVSDQRAGSVLFYNLYSSSIAAPSAQNTRISLTNIHPSLAIAVHLFFVDGATCSIADSLVCLTPNQTASFLASDIDPGTTGYIVAVASDLVTGCPINFNYLIGDEYVKLSSGHAANLAAEAFAALAGGLPACNAASVTTVLNFDNLSYNRAPRVLAASNIPSRADGNDTLIVLNRVGGSLAAGSATLGSLFGILYDDAENPLSFTFTAGVCQFRSSLSNSFPRTAPRFEQFIPAGRSGWAKFYSLADIGLLGAQINFNANAGTAANAFNQGHNLHKLTLTTAAQLTIPIFPPNC